LSTVQVDEVPHGREMYGVLGTALDSAGVARHKGPAKPPPKALSIEGLGFDANQTSRAFVFFISH
jgi:hypothetical protein